MPETMLPIDEYKDKVYSVLAANSGERTFRQIVHLSGLDEIHANIAIAALVFDAKINTCVYDFRDILKYKATESAQVNFKAKDG